jgi:hypothetical protein
MKENLKILLLIIILFGCASKKTLEVPEETDREREKITMNYYLWAFKPNVNIREKSTASSQKIAQLSDGDSVLVMSNTNGWYAISYEGNKTGWVRSDLWYAISYEGNKTGWVRSDLLGPRNLSAFQYAVAFVDSLKENEQIDLYFDKKFYHKRIYLSFPASYYSSKATIENFTRHLVNKYQDQVYRGEVSARVLKAGSDEEYTTLTFKGIINAEPFLPVIPFGRIEAVNRQTPQEITLYYSAPEEISHETLLTTAIDVSGKFPLSYRQVEIIFNSTDAVGNRKCRLWFAEDQNGQEHKFDRCE